MRLKNAKAKGQRFQCALVKESRLRGLNARQLQKEQGEGDVDVWIDAPDFDVYVQCKAGNSHSIRDALRQARAGCPEGGLPVVAIKRDREEMTITMPAWVFWVLIGAREGEVDAG